MDPSEIEELTEIAIKAETVNRDRWLQMIDAQNERNKEELGIGDEQVILREEQEHPGWSFASFFDELTTVQIRSYLRQAATKGCMGIAIDVCPTNGDFVNGKRACKVSCHDIYSSRRGREIEIDIVHIPVSLLGVVARRLVGWARNSGLEAYRDSWIGVSILLKRPPSTLNDMRGV